MPAPAHYFWKQTPALRLLLPLIAGILLQWQLQLATATIIVVAVICAGVIILFRLLPLSRRFQYNSFYGFFISIAIVTAGSGITWLKDIRHQPFWFGTQYTHQPLLVTLQEPLVIKPNSYKALARVTARFQNNVFEKANGNVLLYFKKEAAPSLTYGSQLLITKPVEEIKNAGNPGSFDYRRYSLFKGITHQAFLTQKDFTVLPQLQTNTFKTFIFETRSGILHLLQRYIESKRELGFAEALLIGYKDDLDKNLTQAYTNTGVVHIMAISGLHLGLIYGILLLLTRPLRKKKWYAARFCIVVGGLWLFSLLAGAQVSVVRAAVMFTAIALAEVLNRRTSVYNTLALSALLLLCYQPFWLWDVGFQLSYAAVLSILLFYKPVYNWLYFTNKGVNFLWQVMAVTLAAQVFTLPISLYHFHQFPILFFITNLLAVPMASVILIGAIVLCFLAWLPPVASLVGIILRYLIQVLNTFIERLDALPFAVWDGLFITGVQALLLTAFLACTAYWLLQKQRTAWHAALGFLLLFVVLRTMAFIEAGKQKKMIVYHVPRHQAIDIIDGRKGVFIGDAALTQQSFLQNFHLKPSRIQHRVQVASTAPSKSFQFYNKHIVVIDSALPATNKPKTKVHVVVLSKNPKLYMRQLHQQYAIEQLVIDGSVPAWKARLWQNDCQALGIPCYNTAQKGAFVMNL